MATEREISLKISALTAGGDKIRDLAKEVDELAKKGGTAAPAFEKLGAKLDELANQQDVIQQFANLKNKTVEVTTALAAAEAATRQSAIALQEKRTALAQAAAAERDATEEVNKYNLSIAEDRKLTAAARLEKALIARAIKEAGAATQEQQTALASVNKQLNEYKVSTAAARLSLIGAKDAQDQQAASLKSATTATNQAAAANDANKRSAAALHVELTAETIALQAARDKMQQLDIQSNDLVAAQQRIKSSTQQVTQEIDKLKESAGKAGAGFGQLGQFASRAFAPVTALISAVAGVSEFVRVNNELENINRTLKVITGSAPGAAAEMKFLRAVSNDLGLELLATSKSYAQFAAATKGTALEGEQTRAVFTAVSRAMSAAGKSADDTTGALNALGQMVSKGKVSMEELRGQLGERLPGAFKLAADGLGLTTAQLEKMVSEGKILAVDLLPALSVALDKTYKTGAESAKTTSQQWNVFKNAITDTSDEIGKSGVIKFFLEVGRVSATALSTTVNAISAVNVSIYAFTKSVIDTVKSFNVSIRNLDFASFKAGADAAFSGMRKTISEEFDRAAASIQRFSGQSTAVATVLNLLGVSSGQAAAETNRLAAANDAAGLSAQNASVGWTQLRTIYSELGTDAQKNIDLSEKSVAARSAEASISTSLASSLGTEADQRRAAIDAAESNATALENVSTKRQAELSLLQSELVSLQEEVRVKKDTSTERAKEIADLQKVIAARTEETAKAVAQAQAARVVAAAAKTEAETHLDNSKRIDQLRDAYISAQAAQSALRASQVGGANVTKELADANIVAAAAGAKYRDATRDLTASLEANSRIKQSEVGLAQMAVQLKMAEAQTELEVARATGNQSGVRAASNKIRMLEIEMARIQAKALAAEADATILIVKAKREELLARGELTAVAEAELRATELGAQAKQIQAKIASETADRLMKLKDALDRVADSSGGATGGVNGLSDALNNAGGNADRLAGKLANLRRQGGGGGGDGTDYGNDPNSVFNRNEYGVGSKKSNDYTVPVADVLAERFKRARYNGDLSGFTENDLGQARASYEDAIKNKTLMEHSSFAGLSGITSAQAEVAKWRNIVEQLSGALAQKKTGADASSGSSGNYSVNINLNGQNFAINTSSDADAKALIKLLQQLAGDKART